MGKNRKFPDSSTKMYAQCHYVALRKHQTSRRSGHQLEQFSKEIPKERLLQPQYVASFHCTHSKRIPVRPIHKKRHFFLHLGCTCVSSIHNRGLTTTYQTPSHPPSTCSSIHVSSRQLFLFAPRTLPCAGERWHICAVDFSSGRHTISFHRILAEPIRLC